MKRIVSFIIVLSLVLSSFCLMTSAQETDNVAYRLYVSLSGSDVTGDGTAEKPFTSIEKAKEYIKTLDKTQGDIIVEIHDGTYEISDTLVFDESDSGTDNCRIRYIAADGASPVISGGRRVEGTWEYEGKGIYSIDYGRDKKLRSLYVNGQRCYMTSETVDAKGYFGEYKVEDGSADWAWVSGTAKAGTIFSKNAIPADTRNADDIELMTQTTWNTAIVCVESLERKGTELHANLQMPYGAIAQTPGWGNDYKFNQTNTVYNVFEWLDEPSEFYFDKTEQRLYYCPRADEDINTANVVVPELETIVMLEGANTENRVHNISFEGLTFAYSDWNLYEINGSYGRATIQGAAGITAYAESNWHESIYRAYDVGPAAVYVSSAENISFNNNIICHTGNDGLSFVNDTVNITVNGNVIFDTAGSAILIGHPQHMYIGDKNSTYGKHSDQERYDTTVEGVCKDLNITNNLFKNTSRMFWGDAGVMVFAAENMNFSHNQVENTPYSGLSLGWGWWNMNGDTDSIVPGIPTTFTKNNSVEGNIFLNTITKLGDGGAIYTLGDMPGTVISENYIKGIGTEGNDTYHIRGIHVDEGTKHVLGERNVIDINPSFACIDCGDWGRKGNNTWNNNYSTSESYTTTGSYEPGTVVTNAQTVKSDEWDVNALEVINSAGISDEYFKKIPDDILNASDNWKTSTNTDCDCICHKDGFGGFIYKIMRILWNLLNIKEICECGMYHY